MAKEIELDLSKFIKDLNGAQDIIALAAKGSLTSIMYQWKREAVNLAPVDTSTLRRSINFQTERKGGTMRTEIVGEMKASAIETSQKWGRFDYAYYIHEELGDEFKGRVPGTVGRFLDIPAEQHEAEWIRKIEDDIKTKIREHGF